MSKMRKAIDEKCRDCNYDNLDAGSWREQIEKCIDTACSLHPLRPITIAKGTTANNKQSTTT